MSHVLIETQGMKFTVPLADDLFTPMQLVIRHTVDTKHNGTDCSGKRNENDSGQDMLTTVDITPHPDWKINVDEDGNLETAPLAPKDGTSEEDIAFDDADDEDNPFRSILQAISELGSCEIVVIKDLDKSTPTATDASSGSSSSSSPSSSSAEVAAGESTAPSASATGTTERKPVSLAEFLSRYGRY